MKTWRNALISIIYILCVFICAVDTEVNQRCTAMTDDQESHSGSEILIWRNGNEKRLNRELHNDT